MSFIINIFIAVSIITIILVLSLIIRDILDVRREVIEYCDDGGYEESSIEDETETVPYMWMEQEVEQEEIEKTPKNLLTSSEKDDTMYLADGDKILAFWKRTGGK